MSRAIWDMGSEMIAPPSSESRITPHDLRPRLSASNQESMKLSRSLGAKSSATRARNRSDHPHSRGNATNGKGLTSSISTGTFRELPYLPSPLTVSKTLPSPVPAFPMLIVRESSPWMVFAPL